MIFLRAKGHHEPDETPNFVPPFVPIAEILLDTNKPFRKSGIAVTHSKQTTDFLFDPSKSCKTSDVPVTPSKPMIGRSSIRHNWTLRGNSPLSEKIANSAAWTSRA
jgi:hypothetical protein